MTATFLVYITTEQAKARSPPHVIVIHNYTSHGGNEMKHYTNSHYALNKYSQGIVYKFSNEIVEITLADYLASNPSKTEADFLALKELSDGDYHQEVIDTVRQTRQNVPFATVEEKYLTAEMSAESELLANIDLHEAELSYESAIETVQFVLGKLTEVQRRRFVMYKVNGLTMREIAEIEGVGHTKIQKSLEAAEKKIKKLFLKG